MKKLIFIMFVLLFPFEQLMAESNYYWYKGNKIPIREIKTKRYLLFDSNTDDKVISKEIGSENVRTNMLEKSYIKAGLKLHNNYKEKDYKYMIDSENNNSKPINSNIYHSYFYSAEDGVVVGLSHFFYVKLKNDTDLTLLEKLAFENSIEIVGNNEFMPLWYILSCSNKSKGNALEMANLFYETMFFDICEPDFMINFSVACPYNDSLFARQWGLRNTGHTTTQTSLVNRDNILISGVIPEIDIKICDAHNITKGDQSIIVAVFDRGFELNHPDYIQNVVPNKSYDIETGGASQTYNNPHGTRVAGIIAAKNDNGIGIAGVAPNCRIMPISAKFNIIIYNQIPLYQQKFADGFNWAVANGASVINNSWYDNSLKYNTPSSILDTAIDNALVYGRQGKGCVVVFSSGNFERGVEYPANSNPDIIAVGAISPCSGQRKTSNANSCDRESWGSNYGKELDIMAPGVCIPTTDTGGKYIRNFWGTSAACPHVAGVAALILSVNSNLTQRQVKGIIERTAQKVGGYPYHRDSIARINGTWHIQMGYGLVNAYEAVKMARDYCSLPQTLFENQTITTSITVDGNRVHLKNVKVLRGGKLTVDACTEVTMDEDFEVEDGAEFEINIISP